MQDIMPYGHETKVYWAYWWLMWPRILNELPEEVVSAPTFSSFRRPLKPFLFQQSYPDIVILLYIWRYSGFCGDVYHLGRSKNHWTELNC